MDYSFDNKVALITGAASGIGKSTALAFADHGARVVVADLNGDDADKVAQTINDEGGHAISVHVDVSKPDSVDNMISKTIDEFGQLDIACNNAGIEGEQAITGEYTVEDWDQVINVNLRGVWLCMHAQIPHMLKNADGGSIINMASILGVVGFSTAPAYSAAKHGVIGLTRTAAIEYAPQGIRINVVCPAFIETPMLERSGLLSDPELREEVTNRHPIGRLGQPEEIAEAVLWLASPGASFVHGHPLLVDGGYTAR